jgi:endogenous inhibitor of DNA gyrase (YacG/DUF329 family)
MSRKLVKCPTCRREIDWSASEFRPFCSERCRLIDLGAWLTEKHAIPGEAPDVGTEVAEDADSGDGNRAPH